MTVRNLTEKILENWPAKIVCFTLAILLFLFYRMSTLERRYLSVPLSVETNGDLVPASSFPRVVKVGLRGEGDNISIVQEEDVIVYADLSSFSKEGEFRVPLQTRLKGSALEIDPLEVTVEPSEIVLRLEHRLVKKVPVTASFKGYPEAGYEFAGYSVKPDTVELSGPRSAIERIRDMTTEQIDLTARDASFESDVALVNRNPLISVSGNGKVRYVVSINQTTLVRNFDSVPFYFENLDESFAVETSTASGSIQIKGTQKDLEPWTLPENALTVLCENIRAPGNYTIEVHSIIPVPFEVVSFEPREIQITVRRKPQ
jgi:YbbR domain-containing protein